MQRVSELKDRKQQLNWKQTYMIDSRHIESASKDLPKLFPFSATVTPWNERTSKAIAEHEQGDIEVEKEQAGIFCKLQDIKSNVNNLKETLKYYEQTNEFLVKVQRLTEVAAQKMDQFKVNMANCYEQLAQQEDRLTNELSLFDRKLEVLANGNSVPDGKQSSMASARVIGRKNDKNSPIKVNPKSQKCLSPREQSSQSESLLENMRLKQEQCVNLDKEIAKLGKHLGWTEEDHTDFLTMWHRSQGKKYFEIEDELKEHFTFYTEEQIKEHMNKYVRLRSLNEAKKECIGEYKQLKEQKKQQEMLGLQQRQQQLAKQQALEDAKHKEQEQQIAMKQQVQRWKQLREEKKMEETRKKAQEQQLRLAEENNKRKEMLERNRQLLEQWKEDKKSVSKQAPATKRSFASIDPSVEARIREREEKLVSKKVQIVAMKKKKEEQQQVKDEEIKSKKQIKFSHVNSKVDENTVAVKEKRREKYNGEEKKEACTFGGNLLLTGARATPAWMKGL